MADRSYPPLPEALKVPVYDDHTHIDPFSGPGWFDGEGEPLDWREQLDRASVAGVKGVVQVGTDVESSRWSAEHAAIDPRMLAAVAIHPNDAAVLEAEGGLDDALAVIDELAAQPRVRAVGETGLDFYRTGEDGRAAQFRSFEAHIDIAKRHGAALQIHDRDAHAEVVDTLLRVGAPERTVFHCFSGDAGLARLAASHGWYLSFAGTVTFKNAEPLRDALRVIPRDRILVETDAPWLAPAPVRGRPNAPYLVPHTLRFMAGVLETDVSMLAAQIASTAEAVYGSWTDDAPER
ncbi:TatD family hydrolase [Amnibacterium kyonggiense]|uniref:TatD DNase family protein n=1 Tax=Amnibacterium kyonggiense TaxID=595671 RepID=A0A4V3EB74_9MICO|nr:TatD family hydrolase [Amnibacterium kyonggiense]TDS80604.1 TatD DNase family protein [Amnibacterium kyonggiense]